MDSYFLILCSTHQERAAEIGETVSFFPTLLNGNGNRKIYDGTIRWKLEYNAQIVLGTGEFSSATYTNAVTFLVDKAGWFCATFEGVRNGVIVAEKRIGVIVAPEMIRPSLSVPDDFDIFWQKQLEKLSKVPKDYHLTPLDSSQTVCSFDLQAPCVNGQNISGIFMRPQTTAPRKHPAILLPHGAGLRSAGYGRVAYWAAKGFLALDVNAHGLKNGCAPEYYQEKADGEFANYMTRGFDSGDPSKPYAVNLFLRIVRALEFLSSMPEWDGRNLWLFGGSQGAWQSMAGAYLMPKVSGLACWIPAGCDLYSGGWPFAYLIGKEKSESLRRTMPYFDGCSFCSKLDNISVLFCVGLIDYVCKADGVMAAYNSLKTRFKELEIHYQMQHETMEGVMTALDRFVMTNLKR